MAKAKSKAKPVGGSAAPSLDADILIRGPGITHADAERIVKESAAWPLPSYGGREGAIRAARLAIENAVGEQYASQGKTGSNPA